MKRVRSLRYGQSLIYFLINFLFCFGILYCSDFAANIAFADSEFAEVQAEPSANDADGVHGSHFIHSAHDEKCPVHFGEAKRAARIIYQDHRLTFYCGCRYDRHQLIDLQSCGYEIQTDHRRAKRVEWEHIVPVSQLASHLPCWKNRLCCNKDGHCYKGRRCCQKIDPNFAIMEADLHNLVPEIGELNALRSNYRFGLLPFIQKKQFGDCEFKVDPDLRRVEPAPAERGMIARTYLYMAEKYTWHLSDSQRQLFQAWNKQYPPDVWEIERNQRITKIQGNANPFISDYEVKKNHE